MNELLVRLQQLPGFNNEAVIKAMGSTTHNKFVCWKRTSDSSKGALNSPVERRNDP